MNINLLKMGVVAATLLQISSSNAAPATWASYCSDGTVSQKSSDIPKVNYSNSVVMKAAKKMSEIEFTEINARMEDGKTEGTNAKGDEYTKSVAFNPYTDFEKVYGLCANKQKNKGECPASKKAPEGIGQNTHNMLTILCGEYRDNFSMLKKKLQWFGKADITKNVKQGYTKSKKVFDQITGPGYKAMVEISYALRSLRLEVLGSSGSRHLTVDQKSVQPMSICEYRYILDKYISKGKTIAKHDHPAFKAYEQGRLAYEKSCTKSDRDHVYEFRGDGNLKAQSIESNGMLWFSRAFSSSCTASRKAQKYKGAMTDKDCKDYFASPYKSREKINEQAFLRMLFYPDTAQGLDIKDIMKRYSKSDSKGYAIITEDITGDGVGEMIVLDPKVVSQCSSWSTNDESPGACQLLKYREMAGDYGSYTFAEINDAVKKITIITALAGEEAISSNPKYKKVISNAKYWAKKLYGSSKEYLKGVKLITEVHPKFKSTYLKSKDRGFTRIFKSKAEAWERITTALDRHTDWYSIDTLHVKSGYFKNTFSPFVASSYYIYNSHTFVMPGYAMGKDYDPGRMHWMFVQKVKKSKWFPAEKLNKKWPLPVAQFDIMNQWFDEVTFSNSNLGASENGWDRFGNVKPAEIESIFWLYNADKFEFHH
ncbi:MAG: hypothetical protein CME70_12460 [Halobacteriovorax sp.]|nr:hypothetical protein [Halobacteriovorax sp.]|tara:strand:- start:240449 stop:242404 length:1956 start_codon:yes stop_codon:yes gene_type:complete